MAKKKSKLYKKWWFYLIIFIPLIAILLVFNYLPESNSTECRLKGGDMSLSGNNAEVGYMCRAYSSDFNKQCTYDNQCEGWCVRTSINETIGVCSREKDIQVGQSPKQTFEIFERDCKSSGGEIYADKSFSPGRIGCNCSKIDGSGIIKYYTPNRVFPGCGIGTAI